MRRKRDAVLGKARGTDPQHISRHRLGFAPLATITLMLLPSLLLPLPLLTAQSPTPSDPWHGLPQAAPPAVTALQTGHRILPAAPLDADPVALVAEALAAHAPASVGFRLLLEQSPSLASPRRVLLERCLDGYPVSGETVRLNWLKDGSLLLVDGTRALASYSGSPQLDAEAAAAAARAAYSERWPLETAAARLEVLPLEGGARLSWRVDLLSPASDAVGYRHWIDAETGAALGVVNRVPHAQGTGYTFLPNPVQDLDDPNLDDQNNAANAVPAAAYHQVDLLDLDGSGYLTGPWATTDATAGRTNRANLDFSANRSQRVFEEVLGYYHVDTFQRYLQALGLTARQQRQRIDVYDLLFGIIEYPNASYNPGNGVIAFGTLGVDFAEDADVVVHEYGHAIHHDVQGQLSTGSSQNGAMGEGYGDWFGAIAADDALVGEWVGTDWGGAPGFPAVRRCDGAKRFPADWVGAVHDDGEIWSAALWDIALMVGADTAVTLVVEGMAMQTLNSGFADAASSSTAAPTSPICAARSTAAACSPRRRPRRPWSPARAAWSPARRCPSCSTPPPTPAPTTWWCCPATRSPPRPARPTTPPWTWTSACSTCPPPPPA